MNDENTKNYILSVALNLFSKKGYSAVGVQEICEKSGITKPTLYYYFKSKSGVLENIIQTWGMRFFSEIKNAGAYNHDFINSLTKIIKAGIDFTKSSEQAKDFFNLHIILLNSPEGSEENQLYSKMAQDFSLFFEDFFIKSAAEMGNMRSKEKLFSILFHNNFLSVVKSVLNGKILESDQTIYQIVHSFIYGVVS